MEYPHLKIEELEAQRGDITCRTHGFCHCSRALESSSAPNYSLSPPWAPEGVGVLGTPKAFLLALHRRGLGPPRALSLRPPSSGPALCSPVSMALLEELKNSLTLDSFLF